MTKSQNTKNEQQNDLCITSEQLTEQWKKGELEQKYYYVQYKSLGKSWTEIELKGFLDDLINCRDVDGRVSILAPVPSYDEYWYMISCLNDQTEILNENAKLKELLKECESSIQYYQETYGAMDLDTYTLLTKLNEVLK